MHIDAKSELAGVPILDVRRALREADRSAVSQSALAFRLGIGKAKAGRLLTALVEQGYLEASGSEWTLTIKGNRLRCSTAAAPLHRQTAKRLLEGLIERILLANSREDFLYSVEKAVVFGSYLSTSDRLGDVDVAIRLLRREPDAERYRDAHRRRIGQQNRQFSNMTEEIFRPYTEVLLFLKNRKRGLSLHDYDSEQAMIEATDHRVIFPPRGGPDEPTV